MWRLLGPYVTLHAPLQTATYRYMADRECALQNELSAIAGDIRGMTSAAVYVALWTRMDGMISTLGVNRDQCMAFLWHLQAPSSLVEQMRREYLYQEKDLEYCRLLLIRMVYCTLTEPR